MQDLNPQLKRKAQKVLDNQGDMPLAHLDAVLELGDTVAQAIKEIPQTVFPDVQKVEIINPEKDNGEQIQLLQEILAEAKKKEEYAYDIEIDPTLKAKLKGDKGDSIAGKDGLDGIDGIDGIDGVNGSPDTGDEMVGKINTSELKISSERIEGFKDHSEDIATLQNRTQLLNQIASKPNVGGSSAWGGITGTLSSQTDLQTALNLKQNILSEGAFVNGDKTKLDTYSQANQTTNNAKISYTDAAAVAANTAKTGITAGQASDITANNAKVTNATHTGEVTGSGALTIANNAVTNAKMATMVTKTYKGNTTAGTAEPTDVPVATLKTDLALVKADVGLGSVDNTTDAGKPVSTAQQTALNLKADDSVVVKLTGAQTVAGAKTFSTPIATGSVATMSATVGGGVPTPPNNTTTFLRGDGTFATPAGSGTVTNVSSANADATVATQTTTPVITVVQTPALRSATTTVNVSSATAPTSGQVLTATSGTAATWQTAAGGGDVTLVGVQTLTNKTITDPILPETVSPTTPAASTVKLFGRSKGGRMMTAQIGPSGLDTALQPFMGSNKVAMWSHSGNSTAITAPTLFLFNMAHAAGNQEGTATARNITAATAILNGVRRLGLVTTGVINLSVGIRQLLLQWFRGDATTKGGFFMTARFGYNTAASGNRGFVGFSSNVGVFTVTADPSATGTASTAICIGLGFDAADTNWQVFARTATGDAVTKTDTGIAKPVANKFYEVVIFSAPEATTVSLAIQDINTGTIYNLSTSTALPPQNTLMSQRIWGNTGTSATILGLDTSIMYIETDY